jgi:hypothetical protein
VEELYWEMVRGSSFSILEDGTSMPLCYVIEQRPRRIRSFQHEADMRRNDGKLAEGWYDPQTLEKAIASSNTTLSANLKPTSNTRSGRSAAQTGRSRAGEPPYADQNEEPDDNDDEFGPTLPQPSHELSKATNSSRPGPSIPKLQDLQHAHELAAEDALSSRRQASKDLQADRKAEKAVRKSHLDEIAPPAEPGTRERQLEKRRELAASNRAFASAKTDPADVELPDADVIGGEDSMSELKRLKEIEERKRSEREIRREEVMRARREEREERMREMREKEEKTMEMLREIARARFGAGGASEGGGG